MAALPSLASYPRTPGLRLASLLAVLAAAPASPAAEGTPAPGNPAVTVSDTLELPAARARAFSAQDSLIAKTVIVPTDEDRLMGNLGDLLERVSGVHVVRTGGLGDYTGVSIWGSADNQVNVYVNGVLQNQTVDPSAFLSAVDLSRVERIEVYKGLAPSHLQGSPMGGAINIVTREDLHGPEAQVSAGAGSFGSLRGNAGADFRQDRWQAHAQAVRNQSDGDFTYYDDNGAEFVPGYYPNGAPRLGPGDLIRKTRENNAHAFSEAEARLSLTPLPSLETGVETDASFLHKQIPAPYADLDSSVAFGTFRESTKYFGHGFARWTRPERSASFDVSGSLMHDIYVDTAKGGGAVGTGYNDDRNEYGDFLASLWERETGASGLSLSTLLSYGVSAYRYVDRRSGKVYPWLYRYTGEGKLSPGYTAGDHAVQLVLSGVLYDQAYAGRQAYGFLGTPLPKEEWGREWALQAGYQYRLREGTWLTAQAGSAYRLPTFLEKFGDRGTLVGNPSLLPEAGMSASAGLRMKRALGSLDLQAFARRDRSLITLIQNSQNVLHYSNTGATRTLGSEACLRAAPRPWTLTELDLTLQRALSLEGSADGYALIPYRPRSQLSLRQAFFLGGWTATATGYYQGLAYPNAANSPSLFDAYSHNTEWQSRLDLSLSRRWRSLLAAAAVDNALDQRNFDFFGFPLPGRNLSVTLQMQL